MTTRARLAVTAMLLATAGCAGPLVGSPGTATPSPTAETPDGGPAFGFEPAGTVDVRVTAVVDGDTIDVRMPDGGEERVRLVGIDTPEVHTENDPGEYEGVPTTAGGAACLREAGRQASTHLRDRLSGADATLVFDPQSDRRGGYGRLLAYVVRGDRNVNYHLVEVGHARVYDTDFALREAFDAAESRARDSDRRIWECRSPDSTS